MTTLEDSELLRRYAADRSEAAFGELVRRHLSPVYAFALRQVGGDAHLAQDVAQMVFTALARKASSLTGRQTLGGWLYRTTHFAARDVVRTERRRRTREQEAQIMHESAHSADETVDWEKLHPVLDQTMNELSEEDRDAVWLRFFEGRTFAEVGARLRLTENAARMRVERALDKLHGLLARRGVTSTAAALGFALGSQATIAAPAGLAASVTGTALAVATGAGGTVMTFLNFMSATKMGSGVATAIAVFALAIAFYEVNEAAKSTALLAKATAERDGLRTQVSAMGKQVALQSDDSLAASQRELAGSRAKIGLPASEVNSRSIAAPTMSQLEYVLDHPETKSAFLQYAALTGEARFERFFQTAGLSTEQRDGILKTFVEDAMGRLDALAVRKAAGGLDPNGPPMATAAIERITEIQNRNDTDLTISLRELLGEKTPSFMEFLKSVEERNVADQLGGQLYATATPLTAEQAEALVNILKQNPLRSGKIATPSHTMGGVVVPLELVNGEIVRAMNQNLPWLHNAMVTDAAVVRAEAVLTIPQLAVLRRIQAQQVTQLKLTPPLHSKDGAR
ncbi:MAG: sigma-70 family RNA polymerase sigma factor [Opitutaceae bacterium]